MLLLHVSAEREQTKLQRIVCIAMSGCIRPTPTVSLEFQQGLFPLYMGIEAESIICINRFKYLVHWKAFSNYLSRKNLDTNILEHPLLTMPEMECLLDKFMIRRAPF